MSILSACKPTGTTEIPASVTSPSVAGKETKSAPGIDNPGPKTSPETNKTPPEGIGTCAERLNKIAAVFNKIPANPGSMKPAQADAFSREVESGVGECEKYLEACAAHPSAAEVNFYQAKFLQLLSSRVRAQIIKDMSSGGKKFSTADLDRNTAPYYGRIVSHSASAVAGLADDSELKPEAIELRAWGHTLLKKTKKAEEDYLLWLKNYSQDARSTMITASLGRVLSTLEKYDEGIQLVENKMADPDAGGSPDFPVLVETRWKLYEAKGDPEGLLRSAENTLADYRLRLQSKIPSLKTRETYSRYIVFNGFRKGYALMALGRLGEASEAFNLHVKEINQLQVTLEQKGEALKPAFSIYRQRSVNALDFISERAQRPPPADFNLGEMWVTPRKIRLADSQEKVVALLFRGAGDTRSATFMENIDHFSRANDGIELATIHFFKGARNIDEQLDNLRLELGNAGYESAAGFDPDISGRELFRAWGVYVGSASFLIVDRQGHPVWFQQDPRTQDSNLAKNLLLRIRDSK